MQNEGRSCRVWIERYGGGGSLSHVSAIACVNGIRIFKWKDFLTFSFFFSSSYTHIRLERSSLLVYEYTYLFLLANKRSVVEQFLRVRSLVCSEPDVGCQGVLVVVSFVRPQGCVGPVLFPYDLSPSSDLSESDDPW